MPSPPRRRRATVYIGPVEDRHNAGLAAFFRASFGSDISGETVGRHRASEAAGNPVEPGVEPPRFVFTRDEVVVGYLGTLPERFATRSGDFVAYWLKGFWVDPEFRSGPVGFEVLRCALEQLGATASSTVAPEARRLFEAQGVRDRGLLFNRLRLLRPGRVLARIDAAEALAGMPAALRAGVRALQATRTTGLAGAVASAAVGTGVRLRGRVDPGVVLRTGWDALSDEALDDLWAEFRGTVAGAAERTAALVRWRYGNPDRYGVVSAWRGERLRGWAVVRIPSAAHEGRLKGVSVASLSDLLFPLDDPGAGRVVVAGAEALAAGLDADAVLCSGSHPVLDAVLARRGFLPVPGNLHFMARNDAERVFPEPLGGWWLTRGDAQSDRGF